VIGLTGVKYGLHEFYAIGIYELCDKCDKYDKCDIQCELVVVSRIMLAVICYRNITDVYLVKNRFIYTNKYYFDIGLSVFISGYYNPTF